ncbi:Hypothetical protein SRAE_X000140200 [Strongyloides ratti]|uniref:Uncharacterized protein n=1 Tax=Strongyloides ratti TaxID=34506 RepID=A0A090MNL5_STRRB|nr:Hypothetical protein SRAE_X000140200 [Strongyloides ratti]CEF59656.1 Hypothetical protein SRAE_X000140200 [Strongyloides ratti]
MFEEMEEEAMNISLNFSVMPSQLDTSFNLTTLTTSDDVEIENAVKIIALRLELKGTLNSGKFSKQEMPYRTYIYTQSKYLFSGAYDSKKRKHVERYDKKSINDFVSFISTPLITTMVPWKEMKLIGKNQTKEKIALPIRDVSDTAIIKMYLQYCSEIKKETVPSESTMRKVLSACTTIRNKAKVCVDYFYGNLMDSLKMFDIYLDELIKNDVLAKNLKKNWINRIDFAISYLKSDYKINVKE